MANTKETIKVSVETNEELLHESHQESDPLMSDEARRVMEIIFYVVLNLTVSAAGSAANIINIIIFIKQGFKESVNISLCGLSISDFCVLLSTTWVSICYNPLFRYSDIEFDSIQVQNITGGWPCACFSSITSWITAFINFERCLCVARPMKVKSIFTPERTFISVGFIFLVTFTCVSPVFFSALLETSFNVEHNKTLMIISYANNAAELEHASHLAIAFSQLCSFIIVIICTSILIYTLQAKSQWRNKALAVSSLTPSDSMSLRDKRVAKTVTFISFVFIVCYLPCVLNTILVVRFTPEYSYDGRYQNTFNVSWAIVNTMEAVNSSSNILVYYNMSSKFRMSFKKLFSFDDVSH